MLTFGKKDSDGRYYSPHRDYFIQCTPGAEPRSNCWMGCKVGPSGTFEVLARDVNSEDARYACEDDKYRYPCGCVLAVRPDWWKHCPKCGAALPPMKPYEAPPPKVVRKKKEPSRPEWLAKRSLGTEHGEDWDCIYDGKKWALVRIPGYRSWCSVGQTSYGPTAYEVMRRGEDRGMHVQAAETKGLSSLLMVPRFRAEPKVYAALTVHEGRAKKEDLARFRAMVDELDEKGL